MITQDEIYAERLRVAVRVDELTSGLEPRAVLSRAQRRRARAQVVRCVGAMALTAGLLIGGAEVTGSWEMVHERMNPVADGAVSAPVLVDLAPGVRAAVRPGVRLLADGTHALVLGLTASNVSSEGSEIAVVPNDGANHASRSPAPWRDDDYEIALVADDTLAQRQYWDGWGSHAPLTASEEAYWTRGGAPEPDPLDPAFSMGQPSDLAPDEGWAMAWPFDDGTWLIIGYVPAGTDPDHLARVALREPIPDVDDVGMAALELPTFEAGSDDGRRMFAATISPDVGAATPEAGPTFVLERVPVVVAPVSDRG